jgi:glyoxylase-like metal-dependent hydrolase (beta-lactamase superfamily II)
VTPYIEQAIMKALRKNPDDRHQSVREFCDALRICPAQHNTKHQSSQRASQDTRVTPQVQPTPKGQKSMSSENRMFAVEVAPSSYWVGNRPEKSIFFANPYLRVFLGRDNQGQPVQFNLLIDPGSSNDFATVQAKVGSIIGGVKNISAVFINHQDPDVGSATTLLLGRYAPKAKIICSEDTWRLIQHFNLPRDRFISTDKYPNGFRLPTGHLLIPVPSPFCHFAGAVMLYDPETQILYTGDLFGGLTDANAEGMFADESDWVGMRAFHQIYMPTQRALARVINDIRQIQPPVKMLVPQHGRIIREEMLDFFMKRLESLPVGLDLLEEKDDPIDAWNSVLRRVINTARQMIPGEYKDRLGTAEELQGVLVWENNEPKLTRSGRWAVERVVDHLIVGLPPWLSDPIKMEAVIASEELQVPTPNISMDDGDAGADGQPSPSTMTFGAER